MAIQRARTGQPMRIRAGDWNAVARATEQVLGERTGPGGLVTATREPDIVWVRNASAVDRDVFEVLGIDAPMVLPSESEGDFANRLALDCDTPAAADHTGKFVVLLEPIPAGKCGRAVLSGLTQVHLEMTDEAHGFADVKDADATVLASCAAGAAQILWRDSTSGSDWAVVRLGVPPAPFSWLFESACMIDAGDPDATGEGTFAFTVEDGGASGAPDAATEQRVLLKFAGPVKASSLAAIVPAVFGLGTSIVTNGPSAEVVYAKVVLDCAWITEDFDPATVTWNTKPDTTGGAVADAAWTAYVAKLTDTNTLSPYGSNQPPYYSKTALRLIAPVTTAYGVEVRVAEIRAEDNSMTPNDRLASADIAVTVGFQSGLAYVP
jgi:hypothetical protein